MIGSRFTFPAGAQHVVYSLDQVTVEHQEDGRLKVTIEHPAEAVEAMHAGEVCQGLLPEEVDVSVAFPFSCPLLSPIASSPLLTLTLDDNSSRSPRSIYSAPYARSLRSLARSLAPHTQAAVARFDQLALYAQQKKSEKAEKAKADKAKLVNADAATPAGPTATAA